MLKKSLVVTIGALLLLLTTARPAHAAGFLIYEQGVRATGMGGAVVASPFDPAAGFYNIAGIAFQRHNKFFGEKEGALGMHGSIQAQLIVPTTAYDPDPGFQPAEAEYAAILVPQTYGSLDLHENFYVGLSNTHQWGLALRWPDLWSGRYQNTNAELAVDMWNVHAATRIPLGGEAVDIGLAAGVQIAVPTQFSYIKLQRNFNQDFLGLEDATVRIKGHLEKPQFGYVLGGLVSINKTGTRFGISYKSVIDDLAIEGRFQVLGDGIGLTDGADADLDAELPPVLQVGIAQDIGPVTVEVDVQWTGWSVFDKVVINVDDATVGDIVLEENWKDSLALRTGIEWKVFDWLYVRGGYVYDQSPIPSETVTALLPGNDRHVASVGFDLRFGPSTIEFSYMHVWIHNRRKRNVEGLEDGGTANGNYRSGADLFGVGLRLDL